MNGKETRTVVLMSSNGSEPRPHEALDWMLNPERAAPDWVQISEPVEVEFTLLDVQETNNQRIAAIQQQIDRAEAKTKSYVSILKEQQRKLFAIEHQS